MCVNCVIELPPYSPLFLCLFYLDAMTFVYKLGICLSVCMCASSVHRVLTLTVMNYQFDFLVWRFMLRISRSGLCIIVNKSRS